MAAASAPVIMRARILYRLWSRNHSSTAAQPSSAPRDDDATIPIKAEAGRNKKNARFTGLQRFRSAR